MTPHSSADGRTSAGRSTSTTGPDTARQREAPSRAPRLVVHVDAGITWVRRAGASHRWANSGDLCECVLESARAADSARTDDSRFEWLPMAARRADCMLLYGDSAAVNARRMGREGGRCEVVCCGDEADALRVARIVALPGDTVLHEPGALVVFSEWCRA
ncbi:MAG: hypothetical protein ACK2T6_08060 [Anaerolineae bacterium]